MKNKSRIKLLITCLFALVLSLSLFAFACDNSANNNNNTAFNSDAYAGSNSQNSAEGLEHFQEYVPHYKTYENITVDGVVNDDEWAGKNKISYTFVQAEQTYTAEFSCDFNKDGFVMYSKVSGGPIYYNYGRGSTDNTGWEYYVATSGSGHTNVNTAHKTYEIDITAGGYFLTKLRLQPASTNEAGWTPYVIPLDVRTTVHGTINDANSTEGWTTEWFMPWYAFDDEVAPTSIYVLPAYLYAATKTSTGTTWVETIKNGKGDSSVFGNTGAWGDYSQRFEFTEDGFKDPSDKSVTENIINETPDFGTVTYTGTKETGFTVVATPKAGYEIDYFYVNSKLVTGTTCNLLPNTATGISVMVKFKVAETRANIPFTVNFTLEGAPINYSIEGKKVRFSTSYAEQVATITDGKANFNLPAGEYTATMVDLPLAFGSVTITSSTTTANVKISVDVLTSATGATVTAKTNGFDASFKAGEAQNISFSPKLGKIVWLQTRIVKPSATFSAENGGTYIQIGAEQMTWGTVYDPTVSTNDGWRIRWGIASWTKYDLTADEYTAYKNGELDIAVSVGENAVYGYVKTASSSVWRLVGSKTGSYNGVTAIRTNHSSVASQAKNVQYAIDGFTDTGLVTVNTTVSSGSESGTATAGMANLGGKLIIKQSAASGYSLSEVKVNGVSYPDAVLAAKGTDNDITIKNVEYAEEINVEVVFVQSSTTKTFNFDVKEKFIGQDDSTATNVNSGNIYFYSTTGGESFGGTIANGTVSISLSNGTYEVKSDKALGSVTVQIANGAIVGSNTLYFGKSIFVDSDNNYNVSATNAGYTLTIKDPNTAIKADPAISLVSGIDAYTTTHISFNYVSSSTDSGTGYFPTLKFMGETDFLAIQLCHWGTSLGWKWASDHALGLDKDGDGTASNSEKGTGVTIWNGSFTNKSVRIDIYILGNDVSLYVDGEYSYSFNCLTIWGSQYDSFEIINFGISYRIDALSGHKDWEMNSFKVVEEDVPNAIVTFNGTALTSNTLTKDGLTLTTSAYPVKTTKNVTYTLATGDVGGDLVKITDLIVKVNGVAVDVTLSNNSFTYKIQSVAKDTTLEIIVETSLIAQLNNVELDLNKVYAINGNVTKTAYAGTVTVKDNNSNSNTYTATAGKVTIPTMETGKYTVSIDDANYLTAELNAEKGVNSYALDFNYSMFKVAAVVGGAWNTDVLAGMYDVSDAVNGNLDFNNTSTAGDAYMMFNPELGQIKYVEATVTLNSKALANNEQWITFASAGYGLNTDIYGKTYTVSSKGSYAFRYVANGVDGSTANQFTVRGIDSLGWPQLPVKEVTSESELSYTIKMAIYVDGTNVYMYYAQVGQPLKLWQTKTAKFDRIVSINAYRNTNFQISDLMLYNEAPERAISYTATNGVTYANDNPAKVSIASTATIKVKADNGVVSSVKVNGIALSTETAQDGYVSAVIDPKVIGISEDFVITTELATTFAGTLSLNVDNGEYTDKVLTDGDVVTLTMATTGYKLTGTIANGSVSFDEIIAGTYDIAVDGAKADFRNVSAVTFASDDADKTATVKLVIGNLYKGEAVDDLDAVNGNLTISREMSSPVTLYQFADYMGDIVYAEATITSTVSNISRKEDFHTGFVTPLAVNNSTHGLTFGTRFSPAGGADNTNSTTSTWQVRVMRTDAQPNYWNNTHISGSADKDTVTIRFVYAIDPSKSVTHLYYAPSADADLIYYGQFATANQNKLFGLICMAEGEYSTITDLKISTSVPAYLAPVNVTFSGETDKASVETGTTESVAWGEEGKVVVSTQVGYAVSNITVNGTSVDFVNENGSYVATFSNFKLEGSYDVVVNIGEDATTEKSVTLTVKNSDNILLDKYVMKGAQATVTPASGDATTVTIGANGELSTKLVNGDYTVSIPGYTTFTFTVSGPAVTAEKTVATTGVTKNATLNEKGGLEESEFTGEQTFADNFNGKIVYAEMVVYLPSGTMSGDKGGVWFGFNSNVTKDGTTTYDTGYTWGMHYDDTDANGKYSADSNYWGIRFGGYWKGFTLTKAQYNMLNSSTGLRIAVAIANNVVYGLLDDGNGELVVSRTMKNQEHFDIWRIGKNTTSKISDVKVATDFASAPSVGRQIGNYETYTNVGTILSHDPNFSVSGNETDGFSVTQKNKSANHVASDGLIPFKMEGNKSISFNFNANDYTGAKIFPSIRLFTNRTDKWQIQLCCWSGSWSLKYPKSINVNPEEKAGAITLGAKFEIKADASGKVAVYMDGNLKVTLAAAASTIVGFDFYNNYDGTNGYKVNCDSAGAITSWSFDNLKLS